MSDSQDHTPMWSDDDMQQRINELLDTNKNLIELNDRNCQEALRIKNASDSTLVLVTEMHKTILQLDAELAALRAELAEARQWEDVPVGVYADGMITYDDDGLWTVYDISGSNWIVFEFPDNWRIQRRIQGAQGDGNE